MNIKPGFTSLFNGKDLAGWVGNANYWKVENASIIGRSVEKLDHNDFLWTEKKYSNFIMYCEVRIRGFNSGVQFRSVVDENGHMAGYQADIGNQVWGSLYEERQRGVLVPYKQKLTDAILRPEDWNEYQICAMEDYIILILNGVVTAEINDPKGAKKGIFGLQLHGGRAQEVAFRNLCIKKLDL